MTGKSLTNAHKHQFTKTQKIVTKFDKFSLASILERKNIY